MRLHPVDEGVQPGDLLEVSLLDLAPQSVALRLLPLPHLALEHHTAEEGGRLSAVAAALLGTGVARVERLDAGRPRGGSVQPVRGGRPSVQLALQLRGAVVGLSGGRGGSNLGGLGGQSVRLRGEELGGVADGEGELPGVAVEGRGSLTGSGGFEALLVGERNIKWVDSLLCLSHLRFEK